MKMFKRENRGQGESVLPQWLHQQVSPGAEPPELEQEGENH